MSISAVSRFTGLHKVTILSLLTFAGERCQEVFDSLVRRIRPRYVQLDELWTFVHTKERHLNVGDPAEWDDTYTWIGLDSETKLVIAYLVGKRDPDSAYSVVRDLSSRVVSHRRHQITSDGLRTYIPAIEEYFGADVDYAQLLKLYGRPDNAGPDWYGPGKVIETVPILITGDPDEAHMLHKPHRAVEPEYPNAPPG